MAALLLTACSKGDDISVYKAPKESHAGHDHSHDHEGHNHPVEQAPAPAQPASSSLDWTDPAGWKRESGAGMRVATYKLAGGAECSVVSLEGAAGGDLPNVNRWRGQLGLPEAGSLQGISSTMNTPIGPATVVDMQGAGEQKGRRMAAAIVSDGSTSWFFKLTGPADAVGSAKPGLLKLLGTLRRA